MDDIIRKPMKDVIVPANDIVRRVSNVPEPYVPLSRESSGDRIEKNPFFEKQRAKNQTLPRNTKEGDYRKLLWAILFVFVLASSFFIANYFASATIEIIPVTRSVAIDSNLVAIDGDEDELNFDSMSLVEEKTKEVPATIEKKVQVKASGKVTIFNSYNGDSQRLIKNTRLESPSHKIYRIDESVVVPGAKVVGGKTVPGSVDAIVYADVVGDAYNIEEPVDFTIPGFKGDPRYTKFKAMTASGSKITGGFSGTVKVPSDESIKSAREELEKDLIKIVVEKAQAQIPEHATFFPGSMVFKFEDVPVDFTVSDTTKVGKRATASVFFFDTMSLVEKLVEVSFTENKNNPFFISNMSALKFEFIDPVNNVVLTYLSKIKFHLGGTAEFVGLIDSKKISTELAGKNKKEFGSVISSQSNIYKANLVIRPMWKTVFPVDASKITVKIMTK